MPKLGYYAIGDWNATCDQCGRGFKFSKLSKRWDNAWACDACWEPRQPQDFVRGVKDDPSVPVSRPRSGISFPLTTLASGMSASDTSATLTSGANFPVVSSGAMLIYMQNPSIPSQVEYMRVANHSSGSSSLTNITRAQLGSVARSFSSGAIVSMVEA